LYASTTRSHAAPPRYYCERGQYAFDPLTRKYNPGVDVEHWACCALKKFPTFVDAIILRGDLQRSNCRPEKALETFNAAIAVNPNSGLGYYYRASLLIDKYVDEKGKETLPKTGASADEFFNRQLAVDSARTAAALYGYRYLSVVALAKAEYQNGNIHEAAIRQAQVVSLSPPSNRKAALTTLGNYCQEGDFIVPPWLGRTYGTNVAAQAIRVDNAQRLAQMATEHAESLSHAAETVQNRQAVISTELQSKLQTLGWEEQRARSHEKARSELESKLKQLKEEPTEAKAAEIGKTNMAFTEAQAEIERSKNQIEASENAITGLRRFLQDTEQDALRANTDAADAQKLAASQQENVAFLQKELDDARVAASEPAKHQPLIYGPPSLMNQALQGNAAMMH
jgi:hypothetical protein